MVIKYWDRVLDHYDYNQNLAWLCGEQCRILEKLKLIYFYAYLDDREVKEIQTSMSL